MVICRYDFSGSFVRRKDYPCVGGDCLVFLEKSLQLPLKTLEVPTLKTFSLKCENDAYCLGNLGNPI